jgi:hypothetical protein
MELRFEPCEFWNKKFTLKNTQKKETLMFECYSLLAPRE